MDEDLVDIYEARTLANAQLLSARLEQQGIDSFIDNDQTPLDGLTTGDQFIVVRVLPKDADRARKVAAEFDAEGA